MFRLNWLYPRDGHNNPAPDPGLAYKAVYYNVDDDFSTAQLYCCYPPPIESANISKLTDGQVYYFWVVDVNKAGVKSPQSGSISGTFKDCCLHGA